MALNSLSLEILKIKRRLAKQRKVETEMLVFHDSLLGEINKKIEQYNKNLLKVTSQLKRLETLLEDMYSTQILNEL